MQPFDKDTHMPSGRNITQNCYHEIENTSLFDSRCFQLSLKWISTGKLKMNTIYGSKYCARNECNTIIIAPRTDKHPSSGADRPSDVAVTVIINAELNLSLI